MTNQRLVECISERCLQIVFCHQSKQCEPFSLPAHVYARTHTLAHTEGACPPVPRTRAQLHLSLQSQTRRRRGGVGGGAMGKRDLSSGGADKGGERSAAHMLPFMVLVCSVNPGFCCFPQSAGAQTPSQEARQSLPQQHINQCPNYCYAGGERDMERDVLCCGLGIHLPLSCSPSQRVSECTSIKQSSKYRERHEERSTAVLYRHLELGSVEILIGLTHKQTQRCTHEFIQKAAQGNGPDLSFSKVTAPL